MLYQLLTLGSSILLAWQISHGTVDLGKLTPEARVTIILRQGSLQRLYNLDHDLFALLICFLFKHVSLALQRQIVHVGEAVLD